MTIEETLSAQLRAAMRARDKAVVAALRSALAALANAGAVPVDGKTSEGSTHFAGSVNPSDAEVPRRTLDETEQRAIVAAEIAELTSHADRLRSVGRTADADDAQRAAAVLSAACASP